MRKIYLVDRKKIDYAFLDKELETIEFTLFQNYAIVNDAIVMDIDTIRTFKRAIDDMMIKLRNKQKERKKREGKNNGY